MSTNIRTTIEDLMRVPGKAELVGGEIVLMSPTGGLPGMAGGAVYRSLDAHSRAVKRGYALPDNVAFKVNLPHRESFSPDAAYYTGTMSMGFLEGAPVFAVEVRSEGDYGHAAEKKMADKRRDYFACGTLVVWDIDLMSNTPIKSYSATDPDNPRIFHRGEMADAEPAVPGWTMSVDDLFV